MVKNWGYHIYQNPHDKLRLNLHLNKFDPVLEQKKKKLAELNLIGYVVS